MADHPVRAEETAETQGARLVALLDRIGPLPYRRGKWRCSRCGEVSAAAEDFHSGMYLEEGRCVRRHPPRRTLRCLLPSCCHVEVVAGEPTRETDRPPADLAAGVATAIPTGLIRLLRPTLPAGPAAPNRPAPRPVDTPTPHEPVGGEVDVATAWRRVRFRLRLLFEALSELDEAGGMATAGNTLGWSHRRWAKQLGLIGLLRRMLGDAMQRGRDERGRG